MTDKKITILNVDDNEASRYATSHTLRQAGFEVLEAANGAEALRWVKDTPDLVILDVNLPDMSGFEVCGRIKADPAISLIPILHLSAIYLDDQARVTGLESGADGYLTRPIEPPVLIAYVKALLRTRQAEAEVAAAAGEWRATFDAISDAVFLMDMGGTVLRCNKAMTRLLGKPFSEIIGRPCWELVHGRSEPIEECPLVRMRETRRRESLVLPRGDRWFDVVVDPRLDEGSDLIGAVHIMTDITERRRAEEALQESEERHRSLFERVPVGLYRTTPQGEILDVNPALVQMLGYPNRETMLAVNTADGYANPEDRARWQALVDREGIVSDFEAPWRRYDGRVIWVRESARAAREADGRVLYYEGAVEDITERKQAEEALRESKRQLESRERFISRIVESIPSSLLVIDRALRVISANRNFLEKSRREAGTTLSRKIEEVFPQVLVRYTRLDQKVRDVLRTGEPVEGGRLAYRAPGLPTRTYYYRLIPLSLSPSSGKGGGEGEVENVMLLMDDITEREKLGEEIRRAERHLASVVECAHDLVASMDAEGRILTWNNAAERASGFRSEEVKGRYLSHLCVEGDQQKTKSWLGQLARGRFTRKSIEISLGTKGGEEVPISWTGSRMLDDERRIVGLVAVGRDLTERKRLEAQLIQSAKLTSLGVMAGGIAHEIRNPLAISSAAAQILMEGTDDETVKAGAAEKIYSGIQRASYIIENLLKFARPPEERMAPTDINEALEGTLSLLDNQFRVQQIALRRDFASELPPVVGNKSLIQQVFSNMILNACNAMPGGGSLTITTRVNSDNQVEIQFADTGVGIPPQHLSKIFDPFFTTMPVGKGTGLGLSISYSIIKQQQGTIAVESRVGGGSTFTVILPIGGEPARSAT
jgi:PAS domain S-box-containing protein